MGKGSQRYWIVGAFVVILLHWLPYVVLRGNAHLLVHDNLDSNFVWFKLVTMDDNLWLPNDALIEPFMGETPRSSFPSEFSFTALWFTLMPPLSAYILERGLQAVVGFVGMFLLLRRHVVPGERYIDIQTGVALAFGLLPFWPFGGLSVSGLPLMLYAILGLRRGHSHWSNWLICLVMPFYVHLLLSGAFFVLLVCVIIAHDSIRFRRVPMTVVIATALMCLAFVLSQYRLFVAFLFDDTYISHRTEIVLVGRYSAGRAVTQLSTILRNGHYHAYSLQSAIILPTVLFAVLLLRRQYQLLSILMLTLAAILFNGVFFAFWQVPALAPVMGVLIRFIPFNLGRIHTLNPMLWGIAFAVCLAGIHRVHSRGAVIVRVLIVLHLAFVISFHELLRNTHTPTFNEFFAADQFAEIQAFIGIDLPTYRVASIGIHPSIAQYNGFYTLDGYIPDYPLAYKHQFREIIAQELAKDLELKDYYDTWGSRVYLFVAELQRNALVRPDEALVINDLNLNLDTFRDMGGQFILSAAEIDADTNPEYSLLNVFRHPDSAWDIFLYDVRR